MFKVLLVDDEELDLEGLRRFIPWHDVNLEVIGAANNAFSALEILAAEHVDVLVTDIRMPSKSGLELARAGQERHPHMKIVFVSGYADFQYAKQAISMSASNYVLKPVDNGEMIQVLRKVSEELDLERERSEREFVFHETVPYLKNDLMVRWLEGNSHLPKLVALLEQHGIGPIPCPAAAAIIEIDDVARKLNSYTELEGTQIVDDLCSKLMAQLRSHGMEHYCMVDNHRMACIIRDPERADWLESLIEMVKSSFPMTITVGLGGQVGGPADVPRSYQEAREALEGKWFYGKSRIIRASDKKPEITRDTKDLNDILESLFLAMSRYDLLSVDDCISDLFGLVTGMKGKLSVYHFLLHAIAELNKHLHSLNEDFYKLLDLEVESLDFIYRFETAEDIRSWLRRQSFEISEHLQGKKSKKNRKLVEEIQQYVRQNLSKNITLRQTANCFAFSPNYLGHIFKEDTGVNFSEYVIAQRLDLAKKLLQNPKLKIFEVADRVGYNNLAYFNRHFKETYGMTPGEFRRQS